MLCSFAMSESLDSVYAEIIAHPEQDAPRLRYAELVGGDLAKFVRDGITLRDMRRKGLYGRSLLPTKAGLAALAKNHPEWSRDVLPLVDSVDFGRGFVERITLTARDFLDRAATIFAKAPVLHAQLTRAHGQCAALAASPYLSHLRSLDLSLNRLDDTDAIALAGSPHLGQLRWLELKQNVIAAAGLDALAAATKTRLPSLRYLGIGLNRCVDPVDQAVQDENGVFTFEPRREGSILESKHGPLPWVHFRSEMLPDPESVY
jgi:hypothetical protein